MSPFPAITDTLGALGSLALAVAAMLIVLGAPVIVVLAIRFLWFRHVYVGKSKELEKLIWQLHRIATALEHQAGVSYPAEQPAAQRDEPNVHLSAFGR